MDQTEKLNMIKAYEETIRDLEIELYALSIWEIDLGQTYRRALDYYEECLYELYSSFK